MQVRLHARQVMIDAVMSIQLYTVHTHTSSRASACLAARAGTVHLVRANACVSYVCVCVRVQYVPIPRLRSPYSLGIVCELAQVLRTSADFASQVWSTWWEQRAGMHIAHAYHVCLCISRVLVHITCTCCPYTSVVSSCMRHV